MAYTLVIEKSESRIVFVSDAHDSLLLDALWPTVGYNYWKRTGNLDTAVLKAPWLYVVQQGGAIVAKPYALVKTAEGNNIRGKLLVQLARATNRHRRMVLKEDLIGQDSVYSYKVKDAERYLAASDTVKAHDRFPWLQDAAEFDSITLEQAANNILFRKTQAEDVLRYTENRRRRLTRRILTTPINELDAVRNDLTEYERRG